MACSAGPDVSESGLVLALDAGDRYSFILTEVEVLVVAGGGAGGGYGGNDGAGGGGAGGLIYNRNFTVTPGSAVTVTVGNGGAGVGGAVRGSSGGNSVFGSLTAIGGGGGGSEGAAEQRPGGSGGSGGGGGGYGVGGTGGNGTAGQGNRGGDCTAPGDGGGGGAGSAGENGLTGKGGLGLGFDISGSFVYYAGGGGASGDKRNARGGGGAVGGIGGGGKGQDATNSTPPENGTPNTGGGGGAAAGSNPAYGAGTTLTSGSGGSGIVIVRYPGPQRAIGGTVTTVGGHTIHTFTGSSTFTPLVATNNSTILGLSDLSNRGNFGTTVNSPIYSSANGGSVNFDGINEYMTSTISNNPTTQITLESWIYPERAPSTGTIRGAAISGDPNHYLGLLDSIDGGVTHSLHFALSTSTGRPGSQVGNMPRFAWSHIVGTYDGTRMKAYLNGTLVYDTALTGTISGSGNWTVGCYQPQPTDGTHNFDGLISSAKIYNRALTAAEIQQNFNSLRGRFGI